MCSMKWATPVSSADSRREPARTYAAMETERAPGTRELITRGPEGSAVRSNIAADGTGTRNGAPSGGPERGAVAVAGLEDRRVQPVLHEVDDEGDGDHPHERMDRTDLALGELD